MIIWLLIGLALVWEEGHGGFKQLFGSKVFGSLALVLGINQLGGFGLSMTWLLVFWIGLAGFVFWLGEKYSEE